MNRLFYDSIGWSSGAGGGEIPASKKLTTLKAIAEWIDKEIADHAKEFPGNPPVFVNGAMTALKNLKHFIDLSPSPGLPINQQAELIQKLKEYIQFLGKHISDNASFLYVHGILTPQNEVDKGIQFRKEIAELEAPSPSLPGEQVEGKRFGNISRRIHPATESTDRILPFLPPSAEADQRQARRRGLKAFDDSMKNTLGELIQAEENPFAETDADQQVPEEIVQWIADQLDKRGILAGSNIFKEGAIAMYHHLQPKDLNVPYWVAQVQNQREKVAERDAAIAALQKKYDGLFQSSENVVNQNCELVAERDRLRAGGQSAGEQYRRELDEAKDRYVTLLANSNYEIGELKVEIVMLKDALNKFTNNKDNE